jgi:hypothetical protein
MAVLQVKAQPPWITRQPIAHDPALSACTGKTVTKIEFGMSEELAMSSGAESSNLDSDQSDEVSDMDVGSDMDCEMPVRT